jgi:glucosyl-3-phosphoglycerate synthase
MTRDLAGSLPMESGWGLEMALLTEVFRRAEPRHIAQVDGGHDYDHRHHPLGDERGGLFPMCKEVTRTLLAHLVDEGLPVCGQFLDAVRGSFARELREAVRRSRHLALINGLQTGDETDMMAIFTRAFADAAAEFLTGGASPILPAWNELLQRDSGGAEQIVEAMRSEQSGPF